MGHLHVTAQTHGSASFLHSLSLVFAHPGENAYEQDGTSLCQL